MKWMISLYCLISCLNLQASEWLNVSFHRNFNFYYKRTPIQDVKVLDTLLRQEFQKIEQKINYNSNQSIDIYLYKNKSLNFTSENEPTNPGEINVLKPKINLVLLGSPDEVLKHFKFQVSRILIEEMIFGQSVEDKIKYANILRQPKWLLPGLYYYLSDQWSDESDNTLRFINETTGFESIDLSPEKYHYILSASFWKYLEHNYGASSIYNLLYMIRLTRNFGSAISYTFRLSLKQVFKDWGLFYSQAYQLDQRIPAPINGVSVSKDNVLEILVENDTNYYTLENTLRGVFVFRNNISNGSRKKIFKLNHDEMPLAPFSGALFYHKDKVHLAVNGKIGLSIYGDISGILSKYILPIHNPNYIVSYANNIYVSESSTFNSIIYKCEGTCCLAVFLSNSFISSFDVYQNKLCVSESTFNGHNLFVKDLRDEILLYSSKKIIHEVAFANDSILIFNHGQNGIINGKMLSINSKKVKSLTNFRFNILHHKLSKTKFIEVIDKGDRLEFFSVAKQPVNQYYVYDYIPNSFFETMDLTLKDDEAKLKSYKQDYDSLEDVNYQLPISPSMNYMPSQYEDTEVKPFDILPAKPNLSYYELSKVRFNLTNKVFKGNTSVWFNSFETLMPSNLHLNLGSSFSNKISSNEISLNYIGVLQPQSRDVLIGANFGSNKNLLVNLMHRKRLVQRSNINSSFTSEIIQVQHKFNIHRPTIDILNGLQIRHDRNTPNYTSKESIERSIQDKFQLSVFTKLIQVKNFNRSHFKNSILIEPNLDLSSQTWNVSLKLNSNYIYKLNTRIRVKSQFRAITSQGNSPNFIMIGGKSNDLLGKLNEQTFSDYYTPTRYESLYGVRGFNANHRNGNTAAIFKSQFEFKLLQVLSGKPISNQFLSNLRIHLFGDFGTAFYGKGIYATQNMLGRNTLITSTNSMVVEVNAYRNPSIMSFGLGFSSNIVGYNFQFDYAIGFDDKERLGGIFHIGLGKSF
jgi:hypothetical protein